MLDTPHVFIKIPVGLPDQDLYMSDAIAGVKALKRHVNGQYARTMRLSRYQNVKAFRVSLTHANHLHQAPVISPPTA